MRMRLFVAVLVAGAAVQSAASAGVLPDGGITSAEVAAAMQAKELAVEQAKGSSGDPIIRSKQGTSPFVVFLKGCKGADQRCATMQFYAGFHTDKGTTYESMNNWNRNHRFGRAYQDKEGDPCVEMDMDYEHGATSEAITNNLATWLSLMTAFRSFLTS